MHTEPTFSSNNFQGAAAIQRPSSANSPASSHLTQPPRHTGSRTSINLRTHLSRLQSSTVTRLPHMGPDNRSVVTDAANDD